MSVEMIVTLEILQVMRDFRLIDMLLEDIPDSEIIGNDFLSCIGCDDNVIMRPIAEDLWHIIIALSIVPIGGISIGKPDIEKSWKLVTLVFNGVSNTESCQLNADDFCGIYVRVLRAIGAFGYIHLKRFILCIAMEDISIDEKYLSHLGIEYMNTDCRNGNALCQEYLIIQKERGLPVMNTALLVSSISKGLHVWAFDSIDYSEIDPLNAHICTLHLRRELPSDFLKIDIPEWAIPNIPKLFRTITNTIYSDFDRDESTIPYPKEYQRSITIIKSISQALHHEYFYPYDDDLVEYTEVIVDIINSSTYNIDSLINYWNCAKLRNEEIIIAYANKLRSLHGEEKCEVRTGLSDREFYNLSRSHSVRFFYFRKEGMNIDYRDILRLNPGINIDKLFGR